MKIYYYANDPGSLLTAAVSGLNLAEKARDLAGAGPDLRQHEHRRRHRPPPRPGPHLPAAEPGGRRRGRSDARARLGPARNQRLRGGCRRIGMVSNPSSGSRTTCTNVSATSASSPRTSGTTGQMMTAQGRFDEVYSLGEELRELGAGATTPRPRCGAGSIRGRPCSATAIPGGDQQVPQRRAPAPRRGRRGQRRLAPRADG